MLPAEFAFDPAAHRYSIAGRKLPSVTEVLGLITVAELAEVPLRTLERARLRGERIHQAINLFNREDLDRDSLDAETAGAVDSWALFLKERKAVVVESEQPVYHGALGFAGTPDVVLMLPSGAYMVPDIKGTFAVPRSVGAQTAAYAEAWWHMRGSRGPKPQRACVHLKGGKYELHRRTDPGDWSLFLSCLNVWKYLEQS